MASSLKHVADTVSVGLVVAYIMFQLPYLESLHMAEI